MEPRPQRSARSWPSLPAWRSQLRLAVLLVLLALAERCTGEPLQCPERGLSLEHPAVKAWHPPGQPKNLVQECIEYRDVCFDQGTVVSFDFAHSPANASHVPLPRLDITRLPWVWGGFEGALHDALPHARRAFSPLATRIASIYEGAPDLRQPVFSNCTVPLVMWCAHSAHNLAEFFARAPPRLHALLRDGALSNRTTLVVGGPPGEALPRFMPALLAPFTPFEVVSFSDVRVVVFSQRYAPADGPRTTPEGHPQPRCFRRAYLCQFTSGHVPGLFPAGQAVASYYAQRLPPNPLGFDEGPEMLRVILDARRGPARTILNAEDLVAACNKQGARWVSADKRQQPAESPIGRIQCRLHPFGSDTASDIVAARSADVVVAVHGAGCINWLFMREGSALLEIRPHELGSRGWADLDLPLTAAATQHRLHWYGLNVEDPSLSRPGPVEAAEPRRASEVAVVRDRHTELPLSALREMLLRVAAAGRSRERYQAQLAAGTFNAALYPGGVLRPMKVRTPADAQHPGVQAGGAQPAAAAGPDLAAAGSAGPAAEAGRSPLRTLLGGLCLLVAALALHRLAALSQPAKGGGKARPAGLLLLALAAGAGAAELPPQAGACVERGLDLGHPAVRPWRLPELGKPWGQHCVEYRRVCFDQDAVISHDPAHSPLNASSVPLPRVDISVLTYIWAGSEGVNGDMHAGSAALFAPLEVRQASGYEGAPDVRQPVFSNCTVPLVMWGLWSSHNYLEFFVRTGARVFALQQAGALDARTTLVVGQPAGERAPGFIPTVLRPLTPYDVVSFSTFSQRNTPPDAPRTTAEGHPHQRCFERAYLCAWQAPYSHGAVGLGQAVAAYYAQRLPPNPLGFDEGPEVLRVILDTRRGPVRTILNAEDLVAACNKQSAGWQYDPASPIRRVQCRLHTFGGDSAADVATARSADAVVMVHGAGCTNWLYMAPGSALLELRPHQFGTHGWADGYFPLVGQTGNHSLLWYGLNVEDPAVQKPSPSEGAHPERTKDARLMRDRHTALPLGALREMLLRVAAAGRSRERYLVQRGAGRHYVELLPGGALKPKCGQHNPHNPACTMKAPAPEPPYMPREQREAAAAAAVAATAQQQAAAEAAAEQWGQAFAPATPLQAAPWPYIGLRERPPATALLGAALLLLAAAAVGRSLTGSRKRRQPPHIVSVAAPGLPDDKPSANGHPHA